MNDPEGSLSEIKVLLATIAALEKEKGETFLPVTTLEAILRWLDPLPPGADSCPQAEIDTVTRSLRNVQRIACGNTSLTLVAVEEARERRRWWKRS